MYAFLSSHIHVLVLSLLLCLCMMLYLALDTLAMKAAGYRSFPQSNMSSLMQYIESFSASVLDAQDAILKSTMTEVDEDLFTFARKRTHLTGQDRIINSVIFRQKNHNSEKGRRSVLMLHGYGSGLAFFFTLYPVLMRRSKAPMDLYAIDWLGMGASSRPPFTAPSGMSAEEGRVWAEDWFIDSLRDYCLDAGLDKVTIIAHSFGAYLAVRYANKYPDNVEQLILVSPVAVNDNPYADVLQEISPTVIPAKTEENNKPANPLPAFVIYLWQHHFTPFDFLRWSGPLGPKLCSAWTYSLPLSSNLRWLVHKYTYLIFSAPASSERALAHLLVAGAHARSSLHHALPTGSPVSLIYGRQDWMSIEAGHAARESCLVRGGTCDVTVIEEAGHHSYLEQSLVFNRLVTELLAKVSQQTN